MSNPPEREIGSELTDAMRHSTGSYELVVAAIAAAGLGFWIDYVLGIVPVFTLIFAIAGFIGAGYSLYLTYTQQMAEANTDRTARRDGKSSAVTPESAQARDRARDEIAASEARARDERVSGAQRNAPTGDSVLRANAAHAAQQVSKI